MSRSINSLLIDALQPGLHTTVIALSILVAGFGVSLDKANCQVAPVVTHHVRGGDFTMVELPAGEFQMGGDTYGPAPAGQTAHIVTLTRSFAVSETEVTIGQWRSVMNREPEIRLPEASSGYLWAQQCSDVDCPVLGVALHEVLAFANRLSELEGLDSCYELSSCEELDSNYYFCETASFVGLGCGGYRLPTEAEWEYAARAAHQLACPEREPDCIGQFGWYDENSGGDVHQVALLQPNAWGLYDTLGNAWELVMDDFDDYTASAATDPLVGPSFSPINTVIRGGSVLFGASTVSPTYRGVHSDGPDVGFRLVRTLE